MSTLSALLNMPRPTEEQALGLREVEGDGQTRRYRGRSIDELIPKIEAELGADAIVVRRRRGLEGGIGGFFQRPFVEVEARRGGPGIDVYDEDPESSFEAAPASTPPPVSASSQSPPAPTLASPFPSAPAPALHHPLGAYMANTLTVSAGEDTPEATIEDPPPAAAQAPGEFRELTPDTFGAALDEAARALPATVPAYSPAAPAPPLDPFGEELDVLDRGMRDLQAAPVSAPTRPAVPTAMSRERARIEQDLLDVGVSEDLTAELIDAAVAHVLPFAFHSSLATAVRSALAARIPRLALLPAHSATVAIVGPGGSGKTSCCATLLGAYRRAGILPARCATVTLLGERGEPAVLLSPQIMQPLAIASPHAGQALAQARKEGLLLLDMPALSPAEGPAIERVAGLLEELKPDRVVVALPATLGAKAAAQLLDALAPLRASALAITHSDETDQLGVAVETACAFGLAPEYLLDRSRVRGGLMRVDPTHLAERLLSAELLRSQTNDTQSDAR
jgi:flagellar biosynthesis GTPase FlhF